MARIFHQTHKHNMTNESNILQESQDTANSLDTQTPKTIHENSNQIIEYNDVNIPVSLQEKETDSKLLNESSISMMHEITLDDQDENGNNPQEIDLLSINNNVDACVPHEELNSQIHSQEDTAQNNSYVECNDASEEKDQEVTKELRDDPIAHISRREKLSVQISSQQQENDIDEITQIDAEMGQIEREEGDYIEVVSNKKSSLSDLPSHALLLIFSFLSPLESQAFPLSSTIYAKISNPLYFDSESFMVDQMRSDDRSNCIGILPFYLSGNAFNDPLSDIPGNRSSLLLTGNAQKQKRCIIGNLTFRTHLVHYWEYVWYFRSIYKKAFQMIDSFREDQLRTIFIGKPHPFSLISTFLKDDVIGLHFRQRKSDGTYEYLISTLNIDSLLHLHHEKRKKGEISQWVKNVTRVSSQSPSNLSRNIIGYPRTYPKYGTTFRSAWGAARSGRKEKLELEFEYPVYITEVQIYEVNDVGNVSSISCWDASKSCWISLWSSTEKLEQVARSRIFSPKLNPCTIMSNKIRLEISNPLRKCLYIDAVRMKGTRTYQPRIHEEADSNQSSDLQQGEETNDSSIFESTSLEFMYKPLEEHIRRTYYSHQMPSHIHVSGSLMTYTQADSKGEHILSIDKIGKEKKHVERPLYTWDFCVATRIRNDNKVLCILKRFKDKVSYTISLWDLVQDREVLNHPITECKNQIDIFELADHVIVFARKSVVHLYDCSRRPIISPGTPQSNIENWKHVRGFAHDSRVVAISLNSDVGLVSDTMAVGCVDGSIHLWSLRRGKCLQTIEGFGKSVSKLQLIAAGTLLSATYVNDSRFYIYDCFTGSLFRQPMHLFDRVGWNSPKFSIDGKYLIANPHSENRAVIYRFDDAYDENAAKFIRLGSKTTQDQSSCTIL